MGVSPVRLFKAETWAERPCHLRKFMGWQPMLRKTPCGLFTRTVSMFLNQNALNLPTSWKQMTSAKKVKPSISAAAMIMFVPILPPASG